MAGISTAAAAEDDIAAKAPLFQTENILTQFLVGPESETIHHVWTDFSCEMIPDTF